MSEIPLLNDLFQSLQRKADSRVDWAKIQEIEKDICLLYHQLSSYSYIMDDLFYGDVFNLPYWNFLDIKGIGEEKRKFIREGSLVFIYAMVTEEAGGAGMYLSCEGGRYSVCKKKIEACKPENDDEKFLLDSIKSGFALIDNGKIGDASVYSHSTEIHKRFVRKYFTKITESFTTEMPFKNKN
jgi:hypothetical protein